MSQKENLKDYIKKLVQEYTGTGDSSGNFTDGNDIPSPRPFNNERKEMENYIYKNVYGGDGGHYKNEPAFHNPNRTRFGMYENENELRDFIRKTLEEIEEQAYGYATLTTQGQQTHKAPGVWQEDEEGEIKEQASSAEQKTYEAGLKRLQKKILVYQMRWIEKQMAAATSQAAQASSDSKKGFLDQIAALKDQIAAIDRPQKQGKGGKKQQRENLYRQYVNERKDIDLMRYIDSYKRGILLENTIKKVLDMFSQGKTDEEVIEYYTTQGIQVPESIINKIRTQWQTFEKLKLDLDMSEKDFKNSSSKIVNNPNLEDEESNLEVPEKKLSNRLYLNEQDEEGITKEYPIPPEIEDTLINKLKMDPLIRFVDSLKAVNSIPPSYEIRLLNGETFNISYQDYGLMVKIGPEEYDINHYQEKNYAVKHINRLITEPILKTGEEEELPELPDIGKGGGGSKPLGRPPGGGGGSPTTPSPEPEEPETPEPEEPETPETPEEPEV